MTTALAPIEKPCSGEYSGGKPSLLKCIVALLQSTASVVMRQTPDPQFMASATPPRLLFSITSKTKIDAVTPVLDSGDVQGGLLSSRPVKFIQRYLRCYGGPAASAQGTAKGLHPREYTKNQWHR